MAINPIAAAGAMSLTGQLLTKVGTKFPKVAMFLGALGLGGVAITYSDNMISSAQKAVSAAGAINGPGGIPTNATENTLQTNMFAGTVSGVRNFFVGIMEFFKVIGDLMNGKIKIGDIMSGKTSASQEFSSAEARARDAKALAGQEPQNSYDFLKTGLEIGAAGAAVGTGFYLGGKFFRGNGPNNGGGTPPVEPPPTRPTIAETGRSFTAEELERAKTGTNAFKAVEEGATPTIKKAVVEAIEEGGIMSHLKGGLKRNAVASLLLGGATFAGMMYSGSSKAEAAEQTAKMVIPFADGFEKAAKGDTTGAAKSATLEAVGWASFAAGAAGAAGVGAVTGAAVGSVVPVFGTAVGGIVGGAVGLGVGVVTSVAATTAAEYVWDGLSGLFNSKADPALAVQPAPVMARAPTPTQDYQQDYSFIPSY